MAYKITLNVNVTLASFTPQPERMATGMTLVTSVSLLALHLISCAANE